MRLISVLSLISSTIALAAVCGGKPRLQLHFLKPLIQFLKIVANIMRFDQKQEAFCFVVITGILCTCIS